MRSLRAILLITLFPAAAYAQTPVTEAELTPARADSLVAFFNQPGTTRLTGDARMPAGTDARNVAILAGELVLGARVTGDVVVINGSITFEPGARVDGDIIVIGGPVTDPQNVRARSITLYRELVRYDLRDGVLEHRTEASVTELSAGRAFDFGRFDVIVAARGGYNRVEGLPVQIGPRLTLGHSNPTTLEASLIARTADWENPGHAVRLEQFLGGRRAARIGFRRAEEVESIEQWGFSDRENSLATFLIHRDYRDHFIRDGWAAYFRLARTGEPIEFTMAYAEFDVASASVHDPFTILYNNHVWRAQPTVREARFTTLNTSFRYDTRNDERDPAAGWLTTIGSEVELKGSERYRYGIADVRRYARLSPNAKIAMRAIVAGSIKGDSLPTFRQQSLGGEASLPAYELHEFDCGAHEIGGYGCDRVALVQLEYQSNFRAFSRVARKLGRDFGLLDNIRWVAFVNSGRAWNEAEAGGPRSRGTSDFVTDAGVGLKFGVLGFYWALPLSDRASGANFFIRIGPRL
jgi:hypothetical protein